MVYYNGKPNPMNKWDDLGGSFPILFGLVRPPPMVPNVITTTTVETTSLEPRDLQDRVEFKNANFKDARDSAPLPAVRSRFFGVFFKGNPC